MSSTLALYGICHRPQRKNPAPKMQPLLFLQTETLAAMIFAGGDASHGVGGGKADRLF
jgi:hypothetical protein